tara:strand:- start:1082 stop:1687 length:606 start_codon:yes stop_codon:yes gene_type:complete
MALSSLTVDKCNRVAGGIKRLLLCDLSKITQVDYEVAPTGAGVPQHQVTDIQFATTGAAAGFVEFVFKKGEARYEASTERQDNGVDVTSVNIFMNVPAPSGAQLGAIEDLRSTCEMVAVVQEFGTDTELRFLGGDQSENGTLEFMSFNGGSGAARTDANAFELNLMGEQEQVPFIMHSKLTSGGATTVHSEIIAELLAPTV